MPAMIIRGRNIGPPSTGKGTQNSYTGDQFWKNRVWTRSNDVPKENQRKSRAYRTSESSVAEISAGRPSHQM